MTLSMSHGLSKSREFIRLFSSSFVKMCILFVYTNPKPEPGEYQLIIATNRDEYFARPAQPAHKWQEDDLIIGGKDLEAGREGGTWFGMSLRRTSQFKLRAAALLNVTGEPREPEAAGRGSIVTDYLKGDLTAEEYVEKRLKTHAKTFNAFSFVAVELSDTPQILHYSNVTNTHTIFTPKTPNTPIFLGFGNSLLHEPLIKVLAGQTRFQSTITSTPGVQSRCTLIQSLTELLTWRQRHLPDPVLARRAPTMQGPLSQVCVQVGELGEGGYGTRTHTMLMAGQNEVEFIEDTLVDGKWVKNEFKSRL